MHPMPHTGNDATPRQIRRRVAPPAGAVVGAVLGLVVAGLLDLFVGNVTPVAYLGAALLGAVIGLVLAMLVPAEIDDGADDARLTPLGHDATHGRADAPVEGAHARDTR
jgi:hypothetical protein